MSQTRPVGKLLENHCYTSAKQICHILCIFITSDIINFTGSAEGGVGFPSIVHEPCFSVEGCVYELPLDRLPLLDTCVGFPKVCRRTQNVLFSVISPTKPYQNVIELLPNPI